MFAASSFRFEQHLWEYQDDADTTKCKISIVFFFAIDNEWKNAVNEVGKKWC